MSLFIVLEGALRLEEDFRFAILGLGLMLARFAGRCSLSLATTTTAQFFIIFCVVSVACFDRMSPVCPGLAVISVIIFPPVRNVSRARDLTLLHSMGRTSSIARGENYRYHVRAVRMAGRNRWYLCQSYHAFLRFPSLGVYNTVLSASYLEM